MLWARLNRGGLCGGVFWRRPVTTETVTVTVGRMEVHDNAVRVGFHAARDSAMERTYARMLTLATHLRRDREEVSNTFFNKFLPAWSPETHGLFSDVARTYAHFLLLVGAHLEQGVEASGFMDVWLYHIVPLLMKPLRITEGCASRPTFGNVPGFGREHVLFANVDTYTKLWYDLHDAAALCADDYEGPCRYLVVNSLGSIDWQTRDSDERLRRIGWVMELIKRIAEVFNVAVMLVNRTKNVDGRLLMVDEGHGAHIIMHMSDKFMLPGEMVSDSPEVRKALELAKSYSSVDGWQGVLY